VNRPREKIMDEGKKGLIAGGRITKMPILTFDGEG